MSFSKNAAFPVQRAWAHLGFHAQFFPYLCEGFQLRYHLNLDLFAMWIKEAKRLMVNLGADKTYLGHYICN